MTQQATILIVEDERKIAELLRDYLGQSGFATKWLDNGAAVDDFVKNRHPDLVLLDLMLPGKDGLAVCRELRAHSRIPVIMITARVDEIDKLLGLEIGADDYICKPFSPREVVARVKALLRRVQITDGQSDAIYRGLSIDEVNHSAAINQTSLDLTPVEFRLLALLASEPGRVFSRRQLMKQIYVDGRVVSNRSIDSHVKNLRQKIHRATGSDDLIRSIYGIGYKLD